MPDKPSGAPRIRLTRSLSFRLGLTIALGILITSLLATTGAVWRAVEREIENQNVEIRAMAQVLSASLSAGVAARDRDEIYDKLRALRYANRISFAEIRSSDGMRLAHIGHKAALIRGTDDLPWAAGLNRLLTSSGIVEDIEIRHRGEVVGGLRLVGETPGIRDALAAEFKNTAWWAMIAIILGMLIAQRQQRRIMRPISRLASTMSGVTKDSGLPTRVSVSGVGEVGVLVESYNTMIDQVTERDQVIARHQDHLEQTVEERTHDLRIARDQAEQAAAAKSRFLATMSHEIRTPMNGVLVMAELLARSKLRAEQKGYAQVIARSGQALLELLNDVLDISKLEAEKVRLEKIETPIDDLINDVIMLFWEQGRSRGVELVSTVDANVPYELLCDPTRLRQCLANLVGNALKFTEQGHVAVDVAFDGSGTLEISVRDTGMGIPEDRQQAIFAAFEQADQSTMRTHGGTGLGLAIVSRLTEAMGGQVTVESTVGEGSCFKLALPVESAKPASTVVNGAPPSIALSIERHPALADSLSKALEMAGATLAEPGQQADCILAAGVSADIDNRDTPVVALWPLGTPEPRNALETGAIADVVPVPYTRSTLRTLVERIVSQSYRGAAALDALAPDGSETGDYSFLKVLAVDDGEVNLQVLEDALSSFSVSPDLATNGRDALALVEARAFDLILLDKHMPDLDGYEVARQIREIEGKTEREPATLSLATASLDEEREEEWLAAGFDGFLSKPFKIDDLGRLLAECAGEEPARQDANEPEAASSKSSDSDEHVIDAETLAMIRSLDTQRPGTLVRVYTRFLETLPSKMQDLRTALDGEDPETVRSAAHALKSVCGSAGATELSEQAADLEMRAVEAIADKRAVFQGHMSFDEMRAAAERATAATLTLVEEAGEGEAPASATV